MRRMLMEEANATANGTLLGEEEPIDLEKCSKEYFPLPFLLFFVGYVIILIVDRVILRHSHSHGDDDHEHSHSHSQKRSQSKLQKVETL